jgi:protein-S-isoprenylcysteine O-methyltransferase Ste14
MNTVWLLVLSLPSLADPVPEPEDVQPGWIALVTVLSLCAASLFLWFSMRKQLRRIQVPREGEPESTEPTEPTEAATGPDEAR